MKQKIIIVLFILLINLWVVDAKSGSMKLLAVSELENGSMDGSIADLYLDVQPGAGRVFIETVPLTKIDTQLSTRFAKDIACDYLDEGCENLDFFYSIRARTNIIGGPSAGAAISLLTISVLDDLENSEDTAITGTINSGGINVYQEKIAFDFFDDFWNCY